MRSDVDLLFSVLGRWPGARPEELASALAGVGGLPGLLRQPSGPFAAWLPLPHRERLAAVGELFGRATSAPPLPERILGPEDLVAHLGPKIVDLPVETFWVALLDARGRPKAFEQVATGTLTACLVHPREVFAPALLARAASVVVAHNHPSGDPEPSPEDLALTERLARVGSLLGIPLLDHVVVATRGYRSLGGSPPPCTHLASSEPP